MKNTETPSTKDVKEVKEVKEVKDTQVEGHASSTPGTPNVETSHPPVFYSPSTQGFYDPGVSAAAVPDDAISITDEKRWELIKGRSQGKRITVIGGVPTLEEARVSSADLQRTTARIAQSLLEKTDWTQYGDVRAALKNAEEFDKYRAQIRTLRTNPTDSPEWPSAPAPVWK
jgi:hypothetical protein